MNKGHLKINFVADVKTGQVVSMDVSSEKVGDRRRLEKLMKRAERSARGRRVLTDWAYNSKASLNFLSGEGIRPVIRVAENLMPRCTGAGSGRRRS